MEEIEVVHFSNTSGGWCRAEDVMRMRNTMSKFNFNFKWLPISEYKPISGEVVLIHCITEQLKRPIVLRAVWYDRYTEEDNYNENEATEYCEEKDAYFVREGWYEFNQYDEVNWAVSEEVTHWAKIPLPPVE